MCCLLLLLTYVLHGVALHQAGYDVLELNASDARSKKKMTSVLNSAVNCNAINFSGNINTKRVVIMDEVDGMGGNEDRGGVQELIKIIKESHVPIICICNDRQVCSLTCSELCYCVRCFGLTCVFGLCWCVPTPTHSTKKCVLWRITASIFGAVAP